MENLEFYKKQLKKWEGKTKEAEETLKLGENFYEEQSLKSYDLSVKKAKANAGKGDLTEEEEKALNDLNDFLPGLKRTCEAMEISIEICEKNRKKAYSQLLMATINEVMPAYFGKKLGDKTKEKIDNEIREKGGIWCYFEQDWNAKSSETIISNYHAKDIYIGLKNEENHRLKFVDEDNVIQKFSENQIYCWDNVYIVEDVQGQVKKILKQREKIQEIESKLEEEKKKLRDLER